MPTRPDRIKARRTGNDHYWRGTPTERGYTSAWQRIRLIALQRDGYLCVACNLAGRITRARDVDHIKPLANGGDHSLTNLQSLCRDCHAQKTADDRKCKTSTKSGGDA